MLRLSVILTTYERVRHLELALTGYLRQSVGDFELIVADDGSGRATREAIARFAERAAFPVRHVWHERDGHRRTVILNEAIAAAASDYVVMSDGDCVPAADFLEVHLGAREPDRMLIAGAVPLPARGLRDGGPDWVLRGEHERFATPRQRARLLAKHWKSRYQIAIHRRRRPHNLGLNMSLSKPNLLRVNGYDENFRGWGNADGDLRERLKSVGVWPKSIWHRALVFHLAHPVEPSRGDRSRNAAYARRAQVPAFAEQGIVKPVARPRAAGA